MSCDYEQGRRDENWSWISFFIFVSLIVLAFKVGRAYEQVQQEKLAATSVVEKKADMPAPPMTVKVR